MSLEGVGGLRVLGFCDHVPFTSSGGSERVAWELYRRMAAAGAAITLLTAAHGERPSEDEVDKVRIVSVPAVRLDRFVGAAASLAPRVFRAAFAEAASTHPDVLHANSLHFQSSIAAAVVAARRGVPLVTTVHLANVELLPAPLRTATMAYEHTVGRYVLRRSARVIAVSPSVATHVRSLGVPPERVVVVPNAVDHERFHPNGRDVRRVPHAVMVGRLIPNKGPDLFVDALAALRDRGIEYAASFVGDGPMRAALERTVERRGLSERVTFTGHVTDVAAELRGADVLVRPSLTEGMPLAVLEAMASGVCVVASAVPGTTDLIEHDRNGLLFPARSLPALTEALAGVLTSAEQRARLTAAARETALGYSWDESTAATAAVLCAAAEGASSPA